MKLIAIDMDGTLLSADCTISEANREAILEAQKHGDIVAISTGRSLHDAKHILHDAGLQCPIMTGNGGLSFESGEIIQHHVLPAEVLAEMMDLLEERGLYYEIYTNAGVLIQSDGSERLNKEIKQAVDLDLKNTENVIDIQSKQYGLIDVPDYREIDFTDKGVYKLFVLSFDQEKLKKLRETLIDREDISITSSGAEKFEIGYAEASKGNALLFMANHFGIPQKDTVAMGDNLNDLSMFETAGMSIAMGNAETVVKEQATYVTKDHNANGVAYALKEYALGVKN
ncbi:hydrolase Cof [Virgibacillus phasianinus]|uniref:Hydrolase Cof n=1 Tax=Virgibacillus phasianinus TaxID=2017483 RepID=A0A220U368_9BACI|nr:HAD family hydrolase [Virgibacillus phasianinus]ASK62485.1 hydrolase Cof [Virgibacillus phasianinus]